MSGRHLTQYEYALQQVVMLFGELLSQLAEAHLTHTYQVVFRFCELENIDYLVLRCLNSGASPFEEWANEWLHNVEIQYISTKQTACGEGLIWDALESWYKR